MSVRILGVNGIYNWSWSKQSFTDALLEQLYMYETIDVKYPFMTALLAYSNWAINRRVKKLIKESKEGDCVIAHSFGCLLTTMAMRQGAKYDKVFFFGAAVDSTAPIPEGGANVIYNIFSKDDKALIAGKAFPWSPLGDMGRVGYEGTCTKVINIEAHGNDHGDYVLEENIDEWSDFIQERLDNVNT